MKRLGKYSGKIYDEKDVSTMTECGIVITDEQANDEKWTKNHHLKDLKDCIMCGFGCPMSRK